MWQAWATAQANYPILATPFLQELAIIAGKAKKMPFFGANLQPIAHAPLVKVQLMLLFWVWPCKGLAS
jgi:hypothetical protein